MKNTILCLLALLAFIGFISFASVVKAEEPAKQATLTFTLPPGFNEDTQASINSLGTTLLTLHDTTIILKVQGMGGDGFMLNDFIRVLQEVKRNGNTIIMEVVGPAASADAFVTCFGDKVIVNPGASLLFHQAYGFVTVFWGFINIRSLADDSMILNMSDFFCDECVKKGILTDKDVKVIKSGDDVRILAKSNGSLHKEFTPDNANIMGFTIPEALYGLLNSYTVAFLMLLSLVTYIIRKVGK